MTTDRELNKIVKKFGEGVRQERMKKNLSQEQLGFKSGLDRTYISGIERGERNPSLRNMGKISMALGVAISKLLS